MVSMSTTPGRGVACGRAASPLLLSSFRVFLVPRCYPQLFSFRPHQEDFGKGIPRVFFSGIYPYSRDISVQAPYPYSVNDQLPVARQSGSRRVSKSITHTLDFEESDTLDGLLNEHFCLKSMRGKLQRGSV